MSDRSSNNQVFRNLNTDDIKAKLADLSNVEELLDEIYRLSDLNQTEELIPSIFYKIKDSDGKTYSKSSLIDCITHEQEIFKSHMLQALEQMKDDIDIIETEPENIELLDLYQIPEGSVKAVTSGNPYKFFSLSDIKALTASVNSDQINYNFIPVAAIDPAYYQVNGENGNNNPNPYSEYRPPSNHQVGEENGNNEAEMIIPPVEIVNTDGDTDGGQEAATEDITGVNNAPETELDLDHNQFVVNTPITINVNGQPVEVSPGEYPILNIIYDNDGNVVAIQINVNGQPVWLQVVNGQVVVTSIDPTNNTFSINMPFMIYVNGELMTVQAGEYTILEIIRDINGNIVAIKVLVNGQAVWLQVVDGHVVVPSIEPTGTYNLGEVISIIVDGQTMNINPSDYKILQVIYNATGGVTAVCIEYNGMKVWLYFDESGNVYKVEYIKDQEGYINITTEIYYIYDMYGNKIGVVEPGKYYIYEVRYDQFGHVIAIRISRDGEYEQWIYFEDNEATPDYYLFDDTQTVENEKTKLSFFEKNKAFLGALGVLSVALGATLLMKKKKKKKEEQEENDDEWEEDNLEEGNYLVYDVKEDEEGNIKEARISSSEDSDNEYWVEL